jgi:hypothetical protein
MSPLKRNILLFVIGIMVGSISSFVSYAEYYQVCFGGNPLGNCPAPYLVDVNTDLLQGSSVETIASTYTNGIVDSILTRSRAWRLGQCFWENQATRNCTNNNCNSNTNVIISPFPFNSNYVTTLHRANYGVTSTNNVFTSRNGTHSSGGWFHGTNHKPLSCPF